MTLTISLSAEDEARLCERAAALGKQPADLIRVIVEREIRRPALADISGPIHKRFLASGMTDDELGDMLEAEKHAMRAARAAEAAS